MKKNIAILSLALVTVLNAQKIQQIEFKNLSRISNEIALETLDVGIGEEIDITKINEAIKKFYRFGYFDDIQVFDNEGILEFTFKEKPSISNVEMSGYKSRQEDRDAIIKRIGLAKGTMYTKERANRAKESLLIELQREGFVNSVIELEVEQINDNSVAITIEVNKGDEIIIKKVNYYGAKNFEASDFEKITANKEQDFIPWFFGQNNGVAQIDHLPYEHLRISELYFEYGFLDAKVKPPFLKVDFASNYAKLDFFIEEGEQYRTNDVVIYLDASILDPKTLYPKLKSKKNEILNLKQTREDVEYIKTQVANLGYAFTQVNFDLKKDEKSKKVDVVFSVIPGEKVYINDVFISGNTRTLDRVIRRNVYLASGDLFNLTDYKDSILKLQRSGFFESVTIDQKRLTENSMDLIVKVKETSTGSIRLGGGYGSFDGFIINASVQDRNVFGTGINMGVSIDTSNRRNNYSIGLSNPAIRDSDYNGNFRIFSDELNFDNDTSISRTYDLDRKAVGIIVGAGKEIFRNTYAGLDYKIEDVQERYTFTPQFTGVRRPSESYLISSLTANLSFNNTDDFYFPRNGVIARTSLEYAGLGGDAKFLGTTTSFKYFYSLKDIIKWDAIFRYRAQLSVIIDNGFVPFGSSLYLGGPSSLRGYESFAFGPDLGIPGRGEVFKNSFTNGAELNFPLIPSARMRWGVFYDYGMIGQDNFNQIQRSATGALLEWISPLGPLQLIFSQPIGDKPGDKTSKFEFSLGTSF